MSVQRATAVLTLLLAGLLGIYAYGYLGGGSRPTAQTPRFDLNRVSLTELRQLPGVGDKLAERIVEYRQTHGGFRRLEDLDGVDGVGAATVARLRRWLFVDMVEELDEPPYLPPSPTVSAPAEPRETASRKTAALSGRIDLNRATAEELQQLPGIGPKLAQRILDERTRGPFHSAEDLQRVYGIGAKTVDRLRPYVTVGTAPDRLLTAK